MAFKDISFTGSQVPARLTQHLAESKPILGVSSSQRSQRLFGPLLKAYASALQSKINGSGDMSGEDKAFFTSASVLERGVPLEMQDPYTNVRAFALSDAIQKEKSSFSSTDEDSFIKKALITRV